MRTPRVRLSAFRYSDDEFLSMCLFEHAHGNLPRMIGIKRDGSPLGYMMGTQWKQPEAIIAALALPLVLFAEDEGNFVVSDAAAFKAIR